MERKKKLLGISRLTTQFGTRKVEKVSNQKCLIVDVQCIK